MSLDRLIANSEELMHSHPNDEQAISVLSKAYNNASMHVDTRFSEALQYERTLALLKKSAVASERLVELAPDNVAYRAAWPRSSRQASRSCARCRATIPDCDAAHVAQATRGTWLADFPIVPRSGRARFVQGGGSDHPSSTCVLDFESSHSEGDRP
ncbi:MAG: hypothetical protein WDO56_15095 [Gammaproteobacteria bacterium]